MGIHFREFGFIVNLHYYTTDLANKSILVILNYTGYIEILD
jgi:hypothetical protein